MQTNQVQEVWQHVCHTLQQNLSPTAYNTWIATNPLTELRLIGDDRAIGVISSPTAFHSSSIEKNFYAQIKEVLDQVTGRNTELQFRVGIPQNPTQAIQSDQPTQTQTQQPIQDSSFTTQIGASSHRLDNQATIPSPTQPLSQPEADQMANPLNISQLQERIRQLAKSDSAVQPNTQQNNYHAPQHSQFSQPTPSNSSPAGGLFSNQTIQSMSFDRAKLQAQKAGLRLDYTFDTFAVSTTNELAHAAAFAVSNQPGTAYNPLFIYGGVGVGKTHLMHAVGNNILKNNPDSKILYCTGEDFTNEIVNAIQTKKALLFKEKYRTVDILLIDDVQFIAGKNTVQEEFFHTFNTITKRFGQVILTSDRPPHEISLLEDRLRSRFEAGLMVDIQQPSFELRTAILLIKANAYHMDIPMNLAQMIANRVDSARKIEGVIKSIKSEVELKNRTITMELIDELFKNDVEKPKQRLRVKPFDVIKTVSDYYHIKQQILRGQQRVKSIVRARHLAMHIMKDDLNLPYLEIGRWFSNRDHTSAMHAQKKIVVDLAEDMDLQQELNDIRSLLQKISK
jgi:chromosomal replication initiator protein